jgi:hypothetical protein
VSLARLPSQLGSTLVTATLCLRSQNADVDDYVLAGSEDESVRESDAQSDDEFDIADLAHGMI